MQVDGVQILGKELRHFPERALRELRARAAGASVALRCHGAEAAVSLEAPLVGQDEAGSTIVSTLLGELAVPRGRMVLNTTTRSTREEAVGGLQVLEERGWQRMLVITSAYHVPRSRRIFEDVIGRERVVVHAPEALLRGATEQERAWILEGSPDEETMRIECRVEALFSNLARLMQPLPAELRWKTEVWAGAMLRGLGDQL